ncbi:peptidase M48 Ste24p [Caldithrix abyssi DSM 13497]|uniref:Peptidase M48 Ste24p n=1 Tax=Caldithrix abyssi DSM 13497 TaxID=880073 RepID=H1XVP9_CALAY|nr:M48 family metallopeptidase [Caldithrix abyssi]APF18997.1 Peptidase family M48 [Caldithrix abyssi DSM 13497]EHO42949.1 peptidase M48 Ste24p [Caldithrix abyssi DSM 13497]
MADIFYKLGKRVGKSLAKGRYLYNSAFAPKTEALKAEYRLGSILAREIEAQNTVFDSPYHQLLLESLLKQLKTRVKNKERYFYIKILESDDLNAFALPGGFIFLTSALVQNIERDKDELAFVLSHEMVHIIARHPFKKMVTNYSMEALSKVFRSGSIAAVYGRDMIKKLINSQYSQSNEYYADEYGARLMYSAGFDPAGAIQLLQRFKRWKGNGDRFNYFASHPSIDERILHLKKLIKLK